MASENTETKSSFFTGNTLVVLETDDDKYAVTNLDINKVVIEASEEKDAPPGANFKSYKSFPVKYNYGTDDKPVLEVLRIRTPRMTAAYGVIPIYDQDDDDKKDKKSKDKKKPMRRNRDGEKPKGYHLTSPFEMENEEHQALLNFMHQLYIKVATHIGSLLPGEAKRTVALSVGIKSPIDLSYIDNISATQLIAQVAYPIRYRIDENTNEIVPGSKPAFRVKVKTGQYPTRFHNTANPPKEFAFPYMTKIGFDHIDMIRIPSLYVNAGTERIHIQMQAENVMLLKIQQKIQGNVTRLGSSIMAIQAEQKEDEDALEAEIEHMLGGIDISNEYDPNKIVEKADADDKKDKKSKEKGKKGKKGAEMYQQGPGMGAHGAPGYPPFGAPGYPPYGGAGYPPYGGGPGASHYPGHGGPASSSGPADGYAGGPPRGSIQPM